MRERRGLAGLDWPPPRLPAEAEAAMRSSLLSSRLTCSRSNSRRKQGDRLARSAESSCHCPLPF
jgi:hypothetical protein